jgi:tRNA (guanine-N7-)-methyltransferase
MKNTEEDKFILILTGTYSPLKAFMELPAHKKVELDLGCGKGSFSTALAKMYPEKTILSADVMIGRLRKLVKRNARENVENITPLRVEAGQLFSYILPDSSIDRIHMLCPDPWPKNRHRGNRLLCSNFIGHLHRVLKDNGIFHFSSDDQYYFNAVEKLLSESGIFKKDMEGIADVPDIKTDFERLWLSLGKEVRHTSWIKS